MDFIINNDRYSIDIILFNDDGLIAIPTNHFISLSIKNDIIDWSVNGVLEYSDPFDASERFTLKDEPYSESFFFKNDGSDKLSITISINGITPEIDTVYAIKDIISTNSDISKRGKIVYFTDILTHDLHRNTIDISSATINNKNASISNLNNKHRFANTVDILLEIANYVNPDIEFDTLEKSSNSMFYTSMIDDNGYEIFDYILSKFIGNDETFGIMRYDHSNGHYNIMSIGKLISTYDKSIIEQFTISDNLRISDETFNAYQSTRPSVSYGIYNNIMNYEYSKISPIQNMQINTNRSISTYDPLTKKFTILNKYLAVKTVKDRFVKNIATPIQKTTSPIKKQQTNTQVYPMLSIDKYRLSGYNTKQYYTLNDNSIFDYYTDALKSMILLNDAISFSVYGVLNRKVGDIIEIVAPNMENGRWANRMYGYWIILNISHDFRDSQYVNNIYAVKLTTNKNMELNNDI